MNELGYFIGPTYYASQRPKKAEGPPVEWSVQASDIIEKAKNPNASKKDIADAQMLLHEVGYLEPVLVDSITGKYTKGAINRWEHNTNNAPNRWYYSTDRWWNAIKDKDLLKEDLPNK